MNILVTIDFGYAKHLIVMLTSLVLTNKEEHFDVFILHSSLTQENIDYIQSYFDKKNCTIIGVKFSDDILEGAPITERYPREIYYRIFAAQCLPNTIDRILYLDPDIVILNSIKELYHLDFKGHYLAAATHVHGVLHFFNRMRLKMPKKNLYINSGVMLMNLETLRTRKDEEKFIKFITNTKRLFLPDQDALSAIYGDKVLEIDTVLYNHSERRFRLLTFLPRPKYGYVNLDWIRKNVVIVHYCSKNKPWKEKYRGKLDVFYHQYQLLAQKVEELSVE